MTYIELFDNISIENICACLTNPPERVVFVGGSMKKMMAYGAFYEQMFAKIDIKVEMVYKSVNMDDFNSIVDTLSKIVDEYDDCAVDLTGGDDLTLVAMGIVKERCKKPIKLHYFNISSNGIKDCDNDGITIAKKPLMLSVDDNIQVYGGRIVNENEKPEATFLWDMTPEFEEELETIWKLCENNTRSWNKQMNVLYAAEECKDEAKSSELTTVADLTEVKSYLDDKRMWYVVNRAILEPLVREGFLKYDITDTEISFTYRDRQIKRCLVKAGQALEMKVFTLVRNLKDDDEQPLFNDVMNGVFIDWDGKNGEEKYDCENEIDILAMKGLVPVFISCKNGYIGTEEFYKLKSVAERFGGNYAKKIMVATAISEDTDEKVLGPLKKRAEDMGIRLIIGFAKKDDKERNEILKNIWR